MLMKKILLSMCMLASAMAASAQANLFDPADVDSEGWLWFDTQAKIDKYVGLIDEDNYRLNPDGKVIQLVYADQMPDYPAPIADPEMYGIGSDGYPYGSQDEGGLPMGMDAVKGSIMLHAATANLTYNGGGIALMLPSCTEFALKVSSEASFYLRYLCCKENDAMFSDVNIGENYVAHKWSNIRVYSMFGAPSLGQKTLTGIETMTNGYYDFTIKSDEPRYVYITHGRKYPVYIHAIKVLTAGTSGISDVTTDNASANAVMYNIAGQRVSATAKGLVISNGSKFVK